jgi:hypothetical protein
LSADVTIDAVVIELKNLLADNKINSAYELAESYKEELVQLSFDQRKELLDKINETCDMLVQMHREAASSIIGYKRWFLGDESEQLSTLHVLRTLLL